MKIKFTKEKETKNTIKYAEQPVEGQAPIIGSLYVQRWYAGGADTLYLEIGKSDNAA